MPAIAALVFLAVLAVAVACWVISNGDRSGRVTRMIYVRHGDARCLPPARARLHPRPGPRRRCGA